MRTCFEIIPNGVFIRGSRMITDDFSNDCFPTIWSAVNPRNRGGVFEICARSLVWVQGDFSFEPAIGAYNGTIV